MKKTVTITLAVATLLLMVGCQQEQPKGTETKTPDAVATQEPNNYVIPYSKGPTGPVTIKGPSEPPPQAVTVKENVDLTLPKTR